MRASIPRLVISAPASSAGKTLVSLLTLAWARGRGKQVRAFKCGPDFIDPQFLSAAAGKAAGNLDPWMLDSAANFSIFLRAGLGADFCLVEGAMGLYDGKLGLPFGQASTASVAKLLKSPVVLVLSAAKAGASLAATVLGLQKADPEVTLAGVVFNQVSGERQAAMLAKATLDLTGLPCFGWLPSLADLRLPERHLGLAAPSELAAWEEQVARALPLAAQTLRFEAMAEAAERAAILDIPGQAKSPAPPASPVRIAVARDAAFHFYYDENLELLRQSGAELVFFSPLADAKLPAACRGLILGGGFPEMFGNALAANQGLRSEIRAAVAAGMPAWAECGGLMYLAEELVDLDGKAHAMVGALPARVSMGRKLVNFGYLKAEALEDNLLLQKGQVLRGHEFHHSRLEWLEPAPQAVWNLKQDGKPDRAEAWRLPNGIATYAHVHLGSHPTSAARLVDAWRKSTFSDTPLV